MPTSRLTEAWRDLSLGALTRAVGGAPAAAPDWGAAPRRVLFLRHDRIGDMIMSTAVLRAVARAHPGLRLDVVASRSNAPVLDGVADVGEVLALPPAAGAGAALRLGLALRARGYDAVVDGLVLASRVSATTAALMAGCGAPVRIGMGGARRQTGVYTLRVAPPAPPAGERVANHVDYLAQLAEPFGVRPADVGRPTLVLAAEERAWAEQAWAGAAGGAGGRRLLVNLSAGHPARRWPDAHWIDALRGARARHPDLAVGVMGEPRERSSVRAVAGAAGATAFETPGVRLALALVARADLVLTPDTAVAHAASAFAKPCVTLMLPGAEPFAPYRTPGRVVMSPGPDMAAVAAGRVVDALGDVLGLVPGPGVGAGPVR